MKIIAPQPVYKILSAVNQYVDFLGATYGPAGKSILIALDDFNVKAIDDGKVVSQDFELPDETENGVIKYIKEATAKTDQRVGDGTTTSALIMGAIVREVFGAFDPNFGIRNFRGVSDGIQKGAKEAVEQIKKASKKVETKKELYEVALNSCNNEEIATLISETLFKIGKNGVMALEDSQGRTTECETVNGLELEKGFASPYFINRENEVSLQNPVILLVNKKIEYFKEIVPIIQELVKTNKRELMIVADGFSEEVIANMVMGKLKGMFNPLLVEIPGYGDKLETLKDIAVVIGGSIVDPKSGDELEKVTLDKLGESGSVISKKDKTIILDGKGKSKEIKKRIELLNKQLEKSSRFDKDKLEKRIAVLSGGVAVIRVGANTENEQRTLKAKVEDAINATKVAFKDGIVLGGGKTFQKLKTSSETLNKALQAPRKQLEDNGKEYLDDKVYDPTGVLIASLESGVSIACGLLNIGGIITTKIEKKHD